MTLASKVMEIQDRNDKIEALEAVNEADIEHVLGTLSANLHGVEAKEKMCWQYPLSTLREQAEQGIETSARKAYVEALESLIGLRNTLRWYDEISLSVENDTVYVSGEGYAFNSYDCWSAQFPFDWLEKDATELQNMFADLKSDAEAEESDAQLQVAKIEEKVERAKYEELKAKFENDNVANSYTAQDHMILL